MLEQLDLNCTSRPNFDYLILAEFEITVCVKIDLGLFLTPVLFLALFFEVLMCGIYSVHLLDCRM